MVALVHAPSAYDLSFNQIEIFSSGTGNAPFELRNPDVFRGHRQLERTPGRRKAIFLRGEVRR